ncbi:hypothetical protein CPB85DRAFT_1451800 [Mucidula mucida]|nr:hypothetical protein CPB85DRAFT_1451800 [Mucidula mucida]
MDCDTDMCCPQCGFSADNAQAEIGAPPRNDLRLKELLSCNDPPMDHEAKELLSLHLENQEVLSHLEERISLINSTLNDLDEKKKQVESRLREGQTALHPLRGTPSEVLGEIFRIVVDDFEEESKQNENSLQMNYPSWVLSHVSSRWRRTALSMPHLWTYLACNFDYANSLSHVFLLGAYLARSCGRQLAVTLHSRRSITGHPSLPIILLSCSRWRFAALSLPTSEYTAFNNIPGTFEQLKSVVLAMSTVDNEEEVPPGSITAFKHAPLTSIGTAGSIRLFHRAVDLPWDRIDSFHYEGFQASSSTTLTILDTTKNLKTAEVYIGGTLPANIQPCVNDSVQSLTFTGCIRNAAKLLPRLQMPNLTRLRIQLHEHHNCASKPILQSLSLPTGQFIKNMSLALREADTREVDGLVQLLTSTPILVRLEIVLAKQGSVNKLCRALSRESGLVEGLEVLTLKGLRGLKVSSQLIQLIKSRRSDAEGSVNLRRVKVDYAILVDESVQSAFRQLVKEGLEGPLLLKDGIEYS